jgi:hypothetical protein
MGAVVANVVNVMHSSRIQARVSIKKRHTFGF